MTFGADSAAKTGFQVQVKVNGMGWIDYSHIMTTIDEAVMYRDTNQNLRFHNPADVRIWDYAADAVYTPKQ